MASSLLVGAYQGLADQQIAVDGNPAATISYGGGDFYVWDATAANSICKQLELEIEAEATAGLTTCDIYINKSRKVVISGDATFSLTWTDTLLRDILGFSQGNLSGASSYTAASISDYIWSPAREESPKESILGVSGALVYDTQVAQAPTPAIKATQHNSWRVNEFTWRYVAQARYWTTNEAGGEYVAFHADVLRRFWRWKLYRAFDDDTTSSADGGLGALSVLGPYKMRPPRGRLQVDFDREIKNKDSRFPVTIPCIVVSEISN